MMLDSTMHIRPAKSVRIVANRYFGRIRHVHMVGIGGYWHELDRRSLAAPRLSKSAGQI
jgi:hypothetical protein